MLASRRVPWYWAAFIPLACGVLVPCWPAEPAPTPRDKVLAWPEITRECRPWAYNWWLGSAVDRDNLSRELQRYHDAGLGGVHIIPIYGAKGAENRSLEYLSPAWMEMLQFTVSEAARLGMGVDMTTGTGWCFGGPHIPPEQGGWRFKTEAVDVAAGDSLERPLDGKSVVAVVARRGDGTDVELTKQVVEAGRVKWQASGAADKVYIVTATPGGPAVKRAGARRRRADD